MELKECDILRCGTKFRSKSGSYFWKGKFKLVPNLSAIWGSDYVRLKSESGLFYKATEGEIFQFFENKIERAKRIIKQHSIDRR